MKHDIMKKHKFKRIIFKTNVPVVMSNKRITLFFTLFFTIYHMAMSQEAHIYAVVVAEHSPAGEQRLYVSGTAGVINVRITTHGVMPDECTLTEENNWSISRTYDDSTFPNLTMLYQSGLWIEANSTITVQSVRIADVITVYTAVEFRNTDTTYILPPTVHDEQIWVRAGTDDTQVLCWDIASDENGTVPVESHVCNMTLNPHQVEKTRFVQRMPTLIEASSPFTVYMSHSPNQTQSERFMLQSPSTGVFGRNFSIGPLLGSKSDIKLSVTIIFTNENTSAEDFTIRIHKSSQLETQNITGSVSCSCSTNNTSCEISCNRSPTYLDYLTLNGLTATSAYILTSSIDVTAYIEHPRFSTTNIPGYKSVLSPLEFGVNELRVTVPEIFQDSVHQANFLTVVAEAGEGNGIMLDGVTFIELQRLGNVMLMASVSDYDVIVFRVETGLRYIKHSNISMMVSAFVSGYEAGPPTDFAFGFPASFPVEEEVAIFPPTTVPTTTRQAGNGGLEDDIIWMIVAIILGVLLAGTVIVIVLAFVRPDLFGRKEAKHKPERVPRVLDAPNDMNPAPAPMNNVYYNQGHDIPLDPIQEEYESPDRSQNPANPDDIVVRQESYTTMNYPGSELEGSGPYVPMDFKHNNRTSMLPPPLACAPKSRNYVNVPKMSAPTPANNSTAYETMARGTHDLKSRNLPAIPGNAAYTREEPELYINAEEARTSRT